MKKIILFGILILILIPLVSSQVAIYIPIGNPEIISLFYSLKEPDNNGLDLTVKNIGKEGGTFNIGISCTNNWKVNWYDSRDRPSIRFLSNEIKTIRIPLSCSKSKEECFDISINCEVTVEDTEGSFLTDKDLKDTKNIGFQVQRPIYCGTDKGWCKSGNSQCKDGKVEKCNKYCDEWEISEICNNKCKFKDGEYRCITISEGKSEQRKEFFISALFIVIFIAFILALFYATYTIIKHFKNKFKK